MAAKAFTLDDFMAQMTQVKKLGPMGRVMSMIPGMSDLAKQVNMGEGDVEKQMGRMQAIYNSMTAAERDKSDQIESARRRRITHGAGVSVLDVSQFLRQFETSRELMRRARLLDKPDLRKIVMGLVTGERMRRDPSWVYPVSSDRWLSRAIWMLVGALVAGTFIGSRLGY